MRYAMYAFDAKESSSFTHVQFTEAGNGRLVGTISCERVFQALRCPTTAAGHLINFAVLSPAVKITEQFAHVLYDYCKKRVEIFPGELLYGPSSSEDWFTVTSLEAVDVAPASALAAAAAAPAAGAPHTIA